jgi:FixJ family two-component response regulator
MAESAVISIVDDDESVREALKSLMRSVGYAVQTFVSGEEFLKSKRLLSTDCLILDLRMPGMNGVELQEKISAAGHRIPIVFISAHGTDVDREQALKAGAVDFLYKPFSEEALLKAVQSALKR